MGPSQSAPGDFGTLRSSVQIRPSRQEKHQVRAVLRGGPLVWEGSASRVGSILRQQVCGDLFEDGHVLVAGDWEEELVNTHVAVGLNEFSEAVNGCPRLEGWKDEQSASEGLRVAPEIDTCLSKRRGL